MSNFNDDPLIHEIDEKIDHTEQQITTLTEMYERNVKPHKDQLRFLSDLRRRLTGLTDSPSRDMIQVSNNREEALEEEILRLREQMSKPSGIEIVRKGKFEY